MGSRAVGLGRAEPSPATRPAAMQVSTTRSNTRLKMSLSQNRS